MLFFLAVFEQKKKIHLFFTIFSIKNPTFEGEKFLCSAGADEISFQFGENANK